MPAWLAGQIDCLRGPALRPLPRTYMPALPGISYFIMRHVTSDWFLDCFGDSWFYEISYGVIDALQEDGTVDISFDDGDSVVLSSMEFSSKNSHQLMNEIKKTFTQQFQLELMDKSTNLSPPKENSY